MKRVYIGERDRAKGIPSDSYRCPVACSIQRAVRREYKRRGSIDGVSVIVTVEFDIIIHIRHFDSVLASVRRSTPENILDYMNSFDNNDIVKPISSVILGTLVNKVVDFAFE